MEYCIDEMPYHHARAVFEVGEVDPITACRRGLAELFNVSDARDVIFTSGSTESLNIAIFGLDLEGGHVITTQIEHNSVLRPLKKLELEGKIKLTIVPCDSDGRISPDAIIESIRNDTKLIVVNHCSNVTGVCLDIERIGEITRNAEARLLVDSSQSAGLIPIDVERCSIDLLAFTGHKSLYGIRGIGGLYISPEIELKPIKVGGTGIRLLRVGRQ